MIRLVQFVRGTAESPVVQWRLFGAATSPARALGKAGAAVYGEDVSVFGDPPA
jgi:hypothetical protein